MIKVPKILWKETYKFINNCGIHYIYETSNVLFIKLEGERKKGFPLDFIKLLQFLIVSIYPYVNTLLSKPIEITRSKISP